jgi:hypothetical protein
MAKDGDAYCPALNMWCEEAKAEVDRLEAENKALWTFVKEMRTLQVVLSDTHKPTITWKKWHTSKFAQAEEILHPYEEKPFTYDPDAPLKLA